MDSNRRHQKGMTLLEVLISVTILAIISTVTASSILRSTKFKVKIDRDIEDYADVRDALVIMTRDINAAFHWKDINEEVKKKLIAEAQAAGEPPPYPQTPLQGPTPIPAEKLTAFVGDKDSLYFTSLSHQRIIANSAESDQAKVGYFIKSVKSMRDRKDTKALIRRESVVLDEDVTKEGVETILLEDIKELALEYYGGEGTNREWTEGWKSTESDDKTGNRFPDAVKITLTTTHDGREVKLSTVAAIHMPNNDPPKPPPAAPGQPTTAGGTNTGTGATGTGPAAGTGGKSP